MEGVGSASFRLKFTSENVAGVTLPIFTSQNEGATGQELTGLAKGAGRIRDSKEAYLKALGALIDLASLQTSFVTLDEVDRCLFPFFSFFRFFSPQLPW